MNDNFPQREKKYQYTEYSWKQKNISSIQPHKINNYYQLDK